MAATTPPATEVAVRIVDCDVHPFGDAREISEYVPEPWRSRYYRQYVHEVELNASLYTPPSHPTRGRDAPRRRRPRRRSGLRGAAAASGGGCRLRQPDRAPAQDQAGQPRVRECALRRPQRMARCDLAREAQLARSLPGVAAGVA